MTTPPGSDRNRCRWWAGGPHGRCPNELAFPGVKDVPDLCMAHLANMEPWIASRAAQRTADGQEWINWAARRVAAAESAERASGDAPLLRRRSAATPATP